MNEPTLSAEESDDVVGGIIGLYKKKLTFLQERIQDNQIECHYSLMEASLDKEG